MTLTESAGYLYLYSKDLAKKNKKLDSLRKEEKRIESKIEHAREGHKEKYHEKAVHLERKMKAVEAEHEAILKKLQQQFSAFEYLLKQEEKR